MNTRPKRRRLSIDRRGFTLAEMLVVVAIIGMLMSLLVPAVLGARAKARTAQCANNLKELGTGLTTYDTQKQAFPGYVEYTGAKMTNWVVSLFPYVDRNDLWTTWRGTTVPKSMQVSIRQLVCPADSPFEMCALSYVANCGMQDFNDTGLTSSTPPAPPDWGFNGVFHNHYYCTTSATLTPKGGVSPTIQVRVTGGGIKDGAQHTLMLSENIQAGEWTEPYAPAGDTSKISALNVELTAGMIFGPPPTSASTAPTIYRINEGKTKDRYQNVISARPLKSDFARPSSNHSGGVNVVFCDGHGQFLRENIDPLVYATLMAPDNSNCRLPTKSISSGDGFATVRSKILNEEDYK